MKLINKYILLLLFLLLFLVGCAVSQNTSLSVATVAALATATTTATDTPPSTLTPTSLPEPSVTYLPIVTRGPVFSMFTPIELSDKYVPNPDMGWQNTQGATKRFPSTIAYTRFSWKDINPTENVYDWSAIEQLRQEALDAGQKFHFRVRNAQPAPWGPGQVIPNWVIAKGAVIVNGSQGTEPLYNDCQFLDSHAVFVEALRLQYDGDPDLSYLDIGAYGYYGEWDTDQYDETVNSLDWHARRRLADMYLGGQGLRPCRQTNGTILNVAYNYPGFQQTQLLMPYTPWRKETLFYALDKRPDVGIRHDSLGSGFHQDKFREEIGALVEQTWRNAPIVFEFASTANSPQELASARAFVQEMHGSIVHQNFSGYDNAVESVLEITGFKLLLREITYVSEVEPDLPFIVLMKWENKGSAPPYQPYPLMLYLVDAQENVAWSQVVTTDVQLWEPQTVVEISESLTIPDTLPAGMYSLRVAFVTADTLQPILHLAIEGEDGYDRYPVGSVEILAP